MRIAYITDFSLGQVTGISDALRTTIHALSRRGHRVSVFAPRDDFPVQDPLFQTVAVPSIGVPWAPNFRISSPFGMLPGLREFRPDIVHTHTFGPIGFRGIHSARLLKRPIVGTQHTLPAMYAHYLYFDVPWVREGMKKFAAQYYKRCNAVIAPSTCVAEELQMYGVPNVSVIPNAIEKAIFQPLHAKQMLKIKFQIPDLAILVLGRLDKEKNLRELLTAFSLIDKDIPSVELIFVGDGKEKYSLQQFSKVLGIDHQVRFLGIRKGQELVEIMNACDVYAITSRSETQSLSLLQAMACGLPVVAVSCGALPEIVQHNLNGFLVECGDTQAFARCFMELLVHGEKRSIFGKHSREIAEKYSTTSIIYSLEHVYERTLADALH